MKKLKGISIVLGFSVLLLAMMARVPVTEQHVSGAVLYSFMYGTAGTTYDVTMGKLGTSNTWTVKINFWNDGRNLYIKFDCPDATSSSEDYLWLSFDQEDVRYPYDLMHDGYLSAGDYGSWEDARRLGRIPANDGDLYWRGSDWAWDVDVPGHTQDLSGVGWFTYSEGRTHVFGTMPLNGRDTLDLNVRSGAFLGLYMRYYDAGSAATYVWPTGSAPYLDFGRDPAHWGDLWTMKVYTAVAPHAADEPGHWIAFLGLMNNGLLPATVYFQFYDSTGTEVSHATRTLASKAHFGDYARTIAGVGSFSGSIAITSNQPFTGQLNQHDAAITLFAIYPFTGDWI